MVYLEPSRSSWKALQYYIASGRQRGRNNSVAKPKQSLAFISPLIRLLRHSIAKKSPITHTYACKDAHTHTRENTRLPHKTQLHSNASWTNDYRGPVRVLLCCKGERESCGGSVYVRVCMCVCLCCQRTEREGIDSGERMNLGTWRPGKRDGQTRARWSDSKH